MCSRIKGQGETCLFTCQRLSFPTYLHTAEPVSIVVWSHDEEQNIHVGLMNSVKRMSQQIKPARMRGPASLDILYLQFQELYSLKSLRVQREIWNETKWNLNHFSIIGGVLRKLLHAAAEPATLQSLSPADSQRKQVVCLWDFQLRHTELVVLACGSHIPSLFYDAVNSINSLIT